MQQLLNTFSLTFSSAMRSLVMRSLVILVPVILVLSQPVLSYAQTNVQPDAERQKELTYMVQQDCGSCHGMTLKGGLGPSLLPERIAAFPRQYLMDAVTHGRPDTPMPPWKPILTEGEIQWIVEQLQLGQLGQASNKSSTKVSNSE